VKTSNTFWKIAISISDDAISTLDFFSAFKKLVADALAALQRVFFVFSVSETFVFPHKVVENAQPEDRYGKIPAMVI